MGPDGGPREGAIHLAPEKETGHSPIMEEDSRPTTPLAENAPKPFGSLGKKLGARLSGYFSQSDPNDLISATPNQPVPLTSSNRRTFSRTSRVNGSAYGYGSYRNRLASNATARTRRASTASSAARMRRGSTADNGREPSDNSDLNFAQRLLMANENAVTNIADFWVAAAMNVDNEDPFESDTELDSDEESLDLGDAFATETEGEDDDMSLPDSPMRRGRRPSDSALAMPDSPARRFSQFGRRPSNLGPPTTGRPSFLGSPRRPSGPLAIPGMRHTSSSSITDGTPVARRFSGAVPGIFSHTGVRTPSAVLDAQNLLLKASDDAAAETEDPALAPILESRRQSRVDPPDDDEVLSEKEPSLWSVLPKLVILQYGLLALHSTTHDQIFMSYLVT